MKPDKITQLNLERYLSKRIYPLSLGIGLIISLCFPVTYYFLEYKGSELTASHYAKKSADKFQEIIIAYPNLWKYQIYSFAEIEREISQEEDVISIQLYDENGAIIPNYYYNLKSAEATAWWNKQAPKGVANIVFNNETVGRVEIVVSQKTLLIKAALLLFISATIGTLLAFLSYRFPLRVVLRQEEELKKLFGNMQHAYRESDHLRYAAQRSEKRFRDLVHGLDAIVWEADAETGRFLFISHQVENLFLYSTSEWLNAGKFFKDQIFSEDRKKVLDAYQRSIDQEVDCQIEYRRVSKDGAIVWVQDNIRYIFADERHKQLRGVMVDITNKRRAEESLLKLNRELKYSVQQLEQRNREISILHEMSDMFRLCLDRVEAYRIIGVAAEKLFCGDSGAIYLLNSSGKMLALSIPWGDSLNHEMNFTPDSCWALRRGRTHRIANSANNLVCKNICGENSNECFCIPMVFQGETLGVFHIECHFSEEQCNSHLSAEYEAKYQLSVSMTEHVAMAIANMALRETLQIQAVHDSLTGLFNRRYMEEALVRELALAERTKSLLGVIMIDIDHFKHFNDTHGHDAGDTLLRAFGGYLLNNIREYDIVCRYGGEEFICILPGTTIDNAMDRAEQLRSHLMSLKIEHLGRPMEMVSISAGVAIYPEHGTTPQTLVKAADEALYRAKKKGRNLVEAAGVNVMNFNMPDLVNRDSTFTK